MLAAAESQLKKTAWDLEGTPSDLAGCGCWRPNYWIEMDAQDHARAGRGIEEKEVRSWTQHNSSISQRVGIHLEKESETPESKTG